MGLDPRERLSLKAHQSEQEGSKCGPRHNLPNLDKRVIGCADENIASRIGPAARVDICAMCLNLDGSSVCNQVVNWERGEQRAVQVCQTTHP
jgi:hypothetical protein